MTEKQILPVDKNAIAMQEACNVAAQFVFSSTNKSNHEIKLASYANLVDLLYRAMIGHTPADPERVKSILDIGSAPPSK